MPYAFPEIVRQSGFPILQLADVEAATFYRLIIWQSVSRKVALIPQDRAFADYKKLGLKVPW
ncbi:MAG: hypothetical protein PHI06_13565 [Desulfobulbaceae bacterium]|nr:hypothetical protein [Desulfobulbaceae bacterium]